MATALTVLVLVVAGTAGFIALVVRLSRSMLDAKEAALLAGLSSAGATVKATKQGGLYEGNDVLLELEGRELIVNAKYVSRSLIRANLLVKTGFLPWAIFSRERAVHRVGKSLGISREVQTGDEAFDTQCYVDSPERDETVKRLLADASVREAVLGLLALGFLVQTSTRGVEAFQVVPVSGSMKDVRSADAARHLLKLASAVPGFGGLAFKTPGAVRNVPLAVLVLVLTVGGFLSSLALEDMLGVTLNRGAVLALVVGCGAALWAATLALLSLVARGSSNGMQALLFSGLLTLFGVAPLGATLGVGLNQRLDSGAVVTHQVRVLEKHTRRDQHHVMVEPWESGGTKVRVEATCEAFDPLTVGDVVTVKVHPGALGLTWVEKLDDAPAPTL